MITRDSSALDLAGHVVVSWAVRQAHLHEVASRAWGVFDGEIKGETLYWDPPGPLAPKAEA